MPKLLLSDLGSKTLFSECAISETDLGCIVLLHANVASFLLPHLKRMPCFNFGPQLLHYMLTETAVDLKK